MLRMGICNAESVTSRNGGSSRTAINRAKHHSSSLREAHLNPDGDVVETVDPLVLNDSVGQSQEFIFRKQVWRSYSMESMVTARRVSMLSPDSSKMS
jgi:hypothetical protein